MQGPSHLPHTYLPHTALILSAPPGRSNHVPDPCPRFISLYRPSLPTYPTPNSNPDEIDRQCHNAFGMDLGILVAWGVAFRLVAYCVLQYRVLRSRG